MIHKRIEVADDKAFLMCSATHLGEILPSNSAKDFSLNDITKYATKISDKNVPKHEAAIGPMHYTPPPPTSLDMSFG